LFKRWDNSEMNKRLKKSKMSKEQLVALK